MICFLVEHIGLEKHNTGDSKMKRFHISSCGRSGSKFLAKSLNIMGNPTIHEMGDDWPIDTQEGVSFFAKNPKVFRNYRGFVGWKWSVLTPKFARSLPVQIHMVRHPLSQISSGTTHSEALFRQVEKYIGPPDVDIRKHSSEEYWLARAINYYLQYNKIFGSNVPAIQVEKFHFNGEALSTFCDLTGASIEAGILLSNVSTDINSRPNASKRQNVTIDDIGNIFPQYAEEIKKLADLYGYKI